MNFLCEITYLKILKAKDQLQASHPSHDSQRQNIAGNHHIHGQKTIQVHVVQRKRIKLTFLLKKKASNEDKSSNYGLRRGQDGGQTLHPFAIFLSVLWKNAAWTEVSHVFRNVFLVHLKVTFGHFVQLVAPTDQWLATMFKLLYSIPVNFKKNAEIWRQILRYRFFIVFKAIDFPSC